MAYLNARFIGKSSKHRAKRVLALPLLLLALNACVSPKHFDTEHFSAEAYAQKQAQLIELKQQNKNEQLTTPPQINNVVLPVINLSVHVPYKKPQEVCTTATSGSVSNRSCFNSYDSTAKEIAKQVEDLDAFKHINSFHLIDADEQIESDYYLSLRYKKEVTEPEETRKTKQVLQALTLLFFPINVQVKHSLEVSFSNKNNTLYSITLERETTQAQTWLTMQAYKNKAVESMLQELVMQLQQHTFPFNK